MLPIVLQFNGRDFSPIVADRERLAAARHVRNTLLSGSPVITEQAFIYNMMQRVEVAEGRNIIVGTRIQDPFDAQGNLQPDYLDYANDPDYYAKTPEETHRIIW